MIALALCTKHKTLSNFFMKQFFTNLLHPSASIQSHQINFKTFFSQFCRRTFILLPPISSGSEFHYFKYLRISASIDDMTIPLQSTMYYKISLRLTTSHSLSPRTSLETPKNSFTMH